MSNWKRETKREVKSKSELVSKFRRVVALLRMRYNLNKFNEVDMNAGLGVTKNKPHTLTHRLD